MIENQVKSHKNHEKNDNLKETGSSEKILIQNNHVSSDTILDSIVKYKSKHCTQHKSNRNTGFILSEIAQSLNS